MGKCVYYKLDSFLRRHSDTDMQTSIHKHRHRHTHTYTHIRTHGRSVRVSAKPLSVFVWKHDTHPLLYVLVVTHRTDLNS